jgi:hypothetical protein
VRGRFDEDFRTRIGEKGGIHHDREEVGMLRR